MALLTIIGVIPYFAYLYWTEPCEYEDDEEKKEQNPYRIRKLSPRWGIYVFIGEVYEKYHYNPNYYLYVKGKDVKVFDKPPTHKLCIYIDAFSFNDEMFRRAVRE